MQVEQRKRLYMLLMLKKANEGIKIKELQKLINATIAEMQQEDVAWVEKIVANSELD